eukprot:Phypoly_transcript_13295.p1 GENE.Phypoly_transcript_13295~~Phypoly_transcript_13295.p1  ORF type:complete len:320 (+),score=20.18 Phypoly_transcript_13295:86-1045(+)
MEWRRFTISCLSILLAGMAGMGIIHVRATTLNEEETIEPPKEFQLLPELVSGMLAGVLTCVAFYPLECMEARLQVFAQQKGGLGGEVKPKLGLVGISKQMLAQEGVFGFYKGLLPTLLGSAINWGLYFGIYEYQNNVWKQTHEPSVVGYLRSAIIAGAVCTVVVNPFWVLKIRLATSKSSAGMISALQSILKTEGVLGLWKGVGISLVGISEGAVQFVSYEFLKVIAGPTPAGRLFAGGVARLIAGLATYPYLLLRSALQAQNCPYSSLSDAIQKINARDGLGGFYRGLVPNLIRNVPPAACMFFLVSYLRFALFGVAE